MYPQNFSRVSRFENPWSNLGKNVLFARIFHFLSVKTDGSEMIHILKKKVELTPGAGKYMGTKKDYSFFFNFYKKIKLFFGNKQADKQIIILRILLLVVFNTVVSRIKKLFKNYFA